MKWIYILYYNTEKTKCHDWLNDKSTDCFIYIVVAGKISLWKLFSKWTSGLTSRMTHRETDIIILIIPCASWSSLRQSGLICQWLGTGRIKTKMKLIEVIWYTVEWNGKALCGSGWQNYTCKDIHPALFLNFISWRTLNVPRSTSISYR